MSESLAAGRAQTAGRAGDTAGVAALDARRKLQLGLGVIWVLDGILQFQPSMFTKSFPDMLAESAHGNPGVVAGPIAWSASLIDHHVVVLNAIFATTQLALGLGIAWRPTLKLALAASVAWSLAVWWLGEGFGGILAGTASPVNGAPGPVILYAILAVLLWPADRDPGAPSVAGRATGRRPAQAVWLVLWGSLAAFALLPASRAPGAISDMLTDGADGAPAWLAWIDTHAASALNHHGLAASIVLAVLLALVAVAVYLPAPALRAAIVLAVVLAAAVWLAQGMVFMFLILPAAAGAATSSTIMTMTATESRFSFLTLPLAVYLFGYVVWLGDRVTLHAPALAIAPASAGPRPGYGSGSPSPEPAHPYLAPRCAAICKITMGITMGYMLILML